MVRGQTRQSLDQRYCHIIVLAYITAKVPAALKNSTIKFTSWVQEKIDFSYVNKSDFESLIFMLPTSFFYRE